ncbi:MAG: DUF2079 domain-containing protein [Saprospiraceae bacterium]|nr:DUF2079 domain-containing protein [Saprospiraceae bacterium]
MKFIGPIKHPYIFLFSVCLISRILFKWYSGFDNFELFTDSLRYDMLSDRIMEGDANMDMVAYLIAPLYPYLIALIKWAFGSHWEGILIAFQFVIVAISSVYIYKITYLIFKSEGKSLVAGLIYIFYPLTMWYNFTIVQETVFQCFFIFFIYHFLKSFRKHSKKDIYPAVIFFGLALLTKSHIIILIPIIMVLTFYYSNWKQVAISLGVLFIMVIPHGIVNYKKHNVFTISSYGNGSFFLLGNSEYTYDCITNPKGEMGKYSKAICDPSSVFDKDFVFGHYGQINLLPHKERNKKKFEYSINWIKSNPQKFIKLKWHGLQRFILPGLDYKVYNFKYWIVSFISGLLIYIPGLYFAFQKLKKKELDGLLLFSIYGLCAIIFIVFFPVNRFRVVTLEPFLIIYASGFYYNFIKKYYPLGS